MSRPTLKRTDVKADKTPKRPKPAPRPFAARKFSDLSSEEKDELLKQVAVMLKLVKE